MVTKNKYICYGGGIRLMLHRESVDDAGIQHLRAVGMSISLS